MFGRPQTQCLGDFPYASALSQGFHTLAFSPTTVNNKQPYKTVSTAVKAFQR